MCCNIKNYILYFSSFFVGLAFSFLLYFTVIKKFLTSDSPNICSADLIYQICGDSICKLLFIPCCIIVVTMLSQMNYSNYNYILRNKSRQQFVLNSSLRIIILSFVIALIFMFTAILVSALFTNNFMNWSSYDSSMYNDIHKLIDVSYFQVILVTFIKLFSVICFYSLLCYTLEIITKKAFSLLVVVVLSFINLIYLVVYIGSDVAKQCSISAVMLYFGIFFVLSSVAVLASAVLIKRKDFFT